MPEGYFFLTCVSHRFNAFDIERYLNQPAPPNEAMVLLLSKYHASATAAVVKGNTLLSYQRITPTAPWALLLQRGTAVLWKNVRASC